MSIEKILRENRENKGLMSIEVRFQEGRKNMPLVVFIHGMGMNADVWSNPAEARILGGKYPLRVLLYGVDAGMKTSYADLMDLGFTVLAWSQSRPAGPIKTAVAELSEVINEYRKHSEAGLILIGHSRGGLIARKYLENKDGAVKGLITIATPHHGSAMSKLAVYVSPLAIALNQLLGASRKKDVRSALQRVLAFLSSEGLRELLPDSEFYSGLRDEKQKDTFYLSIGGTNPNLFRIKSFAVPELIKKAVPYGLLPEEVREGQGDGLVSVSSSVLPYADEHRNFDDNHASILFDRNVRDYIVKTVESF